MNVPAAGSSVVGEETGKVAGVPVKRTLYVRNLGFRLHRRSHKDFHLVG